MTRANTEQAKFVPWFAKAGAACSIVPIARFIGPNIFALKGGGYGCLFRLTGTDEESLTNQELDSRMRSVEGALRGLPEDACLYQYTRVMSGYELPRQKAYGNPVTQAFVYDRLGFLEKAAGFRRIDLHWCLTLEPSKLKAFQRKPQENSAVTSRMLAALQKTATTLEAHLGSLLGLRILDKASAFQFFSYLFNLEEWATQAQLRDDTGVDRQIVNNPVAWHSDHLRVGKRHVQMFSLKTTPEASRPCLFSGLLTLDCDSLLCSTWRPKSTAAARHEIDAQEKFISFFKVGVLARVMSGRDTASLEAGAGAKAANSSVDDLSLVIRELDKKAHGEYSLWAYPATRSIIPVRPNDPFDIQIMKQFANRIEAHKGRRFLAEGTIGYVECLWDSEGCPVFTDLREDGTAAVAFLKLLCKLDVYDKDIRFGSYDRKGSVSRTEWRKVLRQRDRRPFERWQVPFQKRNSVRPWLGIKPTFGPGTPVQSPGLFGFRFVMVMTYIVLKADSVT